VVANLRVNFKLALEARLRVTILALEARQIPCCVERQCLSGERLRARGGRRKGERCISPAARLCLTAAVNPEREQPAVEAMGQFGFAMLDRPATHGT
jgi:hypothetical protein